MMLIALLLSACVASYIAYTESQAIQYIEQDVLATRDSISTLKGEMTVARNVINALHDSVVIMNRKEDSVLKKLDTVQLRLEPFKSMAFRQFPFQTEDEALRLLADYVSQQCINAVKEGRFRPLDKSIRDSVVIALRHFREKIAPEIHSINVSYQAGDANRRLVAIQLSEIISSAGFLTKRAQGMVALPGLGYPALIRLRPENLGIADSFRVCILPYIIGDVYRQPDSSILRDELNIWIEGESLFEENGTVRLR